jgi:multiple sugar transport system ATP-binding protein
MNLFQVKRDADGRAHLGSFLLPAPRGAGEDLTLGVRPEDLSLAAKDEGIPATVELLEELGSDAYLHATVRGGDQILVARVDPKSPPAKGTDVWLAPANDNLHWFDTATGVRLAA